MPKDCYNYESEKYEWIDKDGYSISHGKYASNWNDSEYRREEEEEELCQEKESIWNDDNDVW